MVILMKVNDAYAAWKESPSPENWELLGEALLYYVKRLVRNRYGKDYPDTYEEAYGQALIKVFESLHMFDSKLSPFPVWVMIIVKNTCYDITRDRRNKKLDLYVDDWHGEVPVKVPIDDRLYVKQLISKLTPENQVLVRLQLEGYSDAEIAENMGLTVVAVESRWKRIRKELSAQK